jgi:hypothetical protein
MELESARYIFEKYSDITFHGSPSGGRLVIPLGQTDRHTGEWGGGGMDIHK